MEKTGLGSLPQKVRVCVHMSTCTRVCSLSHVFATPWTIAQPAPLHIGFFRQEHWSRLPFPTTGDLPDPGIAPASLRSPTPAGGFCTTVPPGKPKELIVGVQFTLAFECPENNYCSH